MIVNATFSIRLRALRYAPGRSFQHDPDLGRDDLHTGTLPPDTSRPPEAAKAMAARIPSAVRRKCSDKIWSEDSPAASLFIEGSLHGTCGPPPQRRHALGFIPVHRANARVKALGSG